MNINKVFKKETNFWISLASVFVLAIVTILTSVIINDANKKLVPTAPEQPNAASNCVLSYSISTPTNTTTPTVTQTGDFNCTQKVAYLLTNGSGSILQSGSIVHRGDDLLYRVFYLNTSSLPVNGAYVIDKLPSQVSFVSGANCSKDTATGSVIRCEIGTANANEAGFVEFQVKVNTTATVGTFANEAYVQPALGRTNTCTLSLGIELTPTLTSTPTPTRVITSTPTVTSTPTGQCLDVKIYNPNWVLLTSSQLSNLTTGSQVYLCVRGSQVGSGSYDRARFMINGTLYPDTTLQRPGTIGEFCQNYTFPANIYSFSIIAEIHHTILGWLK